MTIHVTLAYTVMDGTILPDSWSLWVGRERPQVRDELLTLDGIIYLIHGDFEQNVVCFEPAY